MPFLGQDVGKIKRLIHTTGNYFLSEVNLFLVSIEKNGSIPVRYSMERRDFRYKSVNSVPKFREYVSLE